MHLPFDSLVPFVPTLRAATASILALSALAGAARTQAGGCARPGMDVVPATHPYGPIDPGDGKLDYIDVLTNTALEFQFGVAGLDHASSIPIGPSFATFALYSASTAEVPWLLGPCAELLLPWNSPVVAVPPATLAVTGQLDEPGPVGLTEDIWFQTATIDLLDPGFQIATSDLARVRFRQGPFQGDPSALQPYGCWYFGNYVWNEGDGVGSVSGRVYWPSACDGSSDPDGVYPLVVICHGDGHNYTDYEYLGRHLARNGFIVASIDAGQEKSNVERALRIRTYLAFLRDHWAYKSSVQNSICLLGHSRGGEAVLTAARKLVNDWGTDHDVDAVICLAPTDSDQNGGTEGLESLSGNDSESLLVVYGSMDEDVAGYCTDGTAPDCGGIPLGPQATGFSIYDRAGAESSTEYILSGPGAVTKSMLFVERADHNRWREGCIDPPPFLPNAPLDCEAHHELLEGYANAFLRWRLKGEADMRPYFTGEWSLATAAAGDVRVTTQFSEGSGRRVIDSFESGPWWDATLATVSKELQVTVAKKGSLYDHGNFTAPHDTDGLVVRWSTVPLVIDPWIRWTIDDGQTFFGDEFRDFTKFGHLSLRAGQMDGAANNTPEKPTAFQVRLRDEQGNYSPKVWVDAFADLSYPHQAQVVTPFFLIKATAKSSLRTARIPLSYFTGVDLAAIEAIELVFGSDAHTKGELLLDSLELVP